MREEEKQKKVVFFLRKRRNLVVFFEFLRKRVEISRDIAFFEVLEK